MESGCSHYSIEGSYCIHCEQIVNKTFIKEFRDKQFQLERTVRTLKLEIEALKINNKHLTTIEECQDRELSST